MVRKQNPRRAIFLRKHIWLYSKHLLLNVYESVSGLHLRGILNTDTWGFYGNVISAVTTKFKYSFWKLQNSFKVLHKALSQPKFCFYCFSPFQKESFRLYYATDDSHLSLN